ncbi:MAG: hypothetical protein CO108_30065 [Deltaproteobacteria bacterium CG_4_9_14_3_um_filter_63_12]|nr:MAG: hypothetical protein COW42_15170 [Deltaproteobacteria bacterium CG17_big_fil_post_rev_8_21_14_2_50_63_7]PJB33786.1 MAG: hypothetical protein CO108_30065 [Deltaproteobacteria bacterium CG_4_9_14_3_um_filter_63_12]
MSEAQPATPRKNHLQTGELIDDRFEIVDFIGAGGFANVYRAKQKHIDRMVALKVLGPGPQGIDPGEFEARFMREARLAAQINHPNVVNIYDFGFTGELRQPYIAMELLTGHNLQDELQDNGPMDPERVLRLIMGCLEALGEGHKLGIIHKDLKPPNLFITNPLGPKEAMRILDFGVARLAEVADGAQLTSTGQLMGTPKYLPPEYIREQIATFALDVYQMGLILVEMLIGRAVVETTSPFECLIVHAQGDLRVPASVMAGPLGPVIKTALAMNYKERYVDADAFLAALKGVDPTAIRVDPEQGMVRLRDSAVELPQAAEVAALKGNSSEPSPKPDKGVGDDETFVLDTGRSERIHTDRNELEFSQNTSNNPILPPSTRSVEDDDVPSVANNRTRNLLIAAVVAAAVLAAAAYVVSWGSPKGDAKAGTEASKPQEQPINEPASQPDIVHAPDATTNVAETKPVEPPTTPEVVEEPFALEAKQKVEVDIRSNPSGAAIFYDGGQVGETPTALVFPLEEGKEQTLTLKREGYEDREVSFVPTKGSTVQETLTALTGTSVELKDPIKKNGHARKKDDPPTDPTTVPKDGPTANGDKGKTGPTLLIAD